MLQTRAVAVEPWIGSGNPILLKHDRTRGLGWVLTISGRVQIDLIFFKRIFPKIISKDFFPVYSSNEKQCQNTVTKRPLITMWKMQNKWKKLEKVKHNILKYPIRASAIDDRKSTRIFCALVYMIYRFLLILQSMLCLVQLGNV